VVHRLEAEQAAGTGSPHYGAPVTTGHDKQQGLAQAHTPAEHVDISLAQVLVLSVLCHAWRIQLPVKFAISVTSSS
jgi:hypothetical protein